MGDGRNTSDERIERFMVSKKENGDMFYPKTIPKRREKTTIWVTTTLINIFFIGAIFFNNDVLYTVEAISYGLLTIFLVELIFRVILLLEELLKHFASRYGSDYKKLMEHIFYFSWLPILFFVLAFFISIVFFMKHGFVDVTKMGSASLVLTVSGLLLLKKIICLEKAPIYNSLKIEENECLDYGSGMALSFFYGYLNLVLPKSGKEDKNLKEAIEIYTDSHGVHFPIAALFLLIPKSCICPVSLDDKFPNIEACPSLAEKRINIAGVLNRSYKNSVYKIFDKKDQRKICICVEYATPLRTFREGLQSGGVQSETFKRHKDEIILQFYLTLNELLKKDPLITDLCDLIYYDDIDENGKFRDVSQIILSKIGKLKREKRGAKKSQ